MKLSKNYLLSGIVIIFTVALLSWSYSNNSTTASNTALWSYTHDKNFEELTEAEVSSFIADDDEWYFSPRSFKKRPTAEDVLIQKIPGDKSHLLMMAFYSKENYSEPVVRINNGGTTLVFRDDGKGDDKKAGDGFYTAKITVDVNEFRQKALGMIAEMKKNGYKPFHFVQRSMVYDPDITESFDVQKMDKSEAVSISGLTNALSSDLTTTGTKLNNIRTHSMMITNLAVVEDSIRTWNSCTQTGNIDGPWTFKTIMKNLASKDSAHPATDAQISDFVKSWLNHWTTDQMVNGDSVAARTSMSTVILNPWLNKSKSAGAPAGQLDMRFAPFKLLAIVNRFDLRDGALDGLPGSPVGEGRFVFGLIKKDCSTFLKMTVILEYGVHKSATCEDRQAWAHQWYALKDLAIGSSEYNQALQNITDQYSLCGTNPNKPNQSSLDQLRTNEVALSPDGKTWEMREFVIDSTTATGLLKQTTVGQNPADKYNAQTANEDVQRMVAFVNQNSKSIRAETYTVPLTFDSVPFLGGSAHINTASTGNPPGVFHWDGTEDGKGSPTFIRNNAARFFFSLNTCAGCHAGETQTSFTHVDPVFFGTETTLSGFVTGRPGQGGAVDFDNNPDNDSMSVKDAALRPSIDPKIRTFNEILRRAKDLKSVAETTCGTVLSISSELMFKPLNSVD